VSVGIAEDEANGCEEITLARAIATNDDIVFRRKWFDDRLVLVATIEKQQTISVNVPKILGTSSNVARLTS
jgi:hypothetical protein